MLYIARIMLSACLSVRPLHAGILSKRQTFSLSDSHTTLVYAHQTLWQYSDTDPLTGASNAEGIQNRNFRPVPRIISEMIQNRAIVATECE